jgi:hypothetical protein
MPNRALPWSGLRAHLRTNTLTVGPPESRDRWLLNALTSGTAKLRLREYFRSIPASEDQPGGVNLLTKTDGIT